MISLTVQWEKEALRMGSEFCTSVRKNHSPHSTEAVGTWKLSVLTGCGQYDRKLSFIIAKRVSLRLANCLSVAKCILLQFPNKANQMVLQQNVWVYRSFNKNCIDIHGNLSRYVAYRDEVQCSQGFQTMLFRKKTQTPPPVLRFWL